MESVILNLEAYDDVGGLQQTIIFIINYSASYFLDSVVYPFVRITKDSTKSHNKYVAFLLD